jgi:hypothetical protein
MVLAFAFLAGFAPLGSTSSVHLCTMECCAFKPPHEAGSCIHGACEAVLPAPQPSPPQPHEELCEAHNQQTTQHGEAHAHRDAHTHGDAHPHDEAMQMPVDAAPLAENSSTPTHAHEHSADSSSKTSTSESAPPDATEMRAFAKPCPPECGAGTCGSSTQSRPRDDAALAHADKPRPPSTPHLFHASDNPTATLDALCRRSRPRGPPAFFS